MVASSTQDILFGMSKSKVRSKRTVDALVSLLALAILVVPMVIIGGLIRALSPGSALFQQKRIGRRGEVFQAVKFRTMRVDAEKDGSVTVRGDRRVTGIGRFLRTTKLDELPQLWNVLVGNMSFVGPRPDVPGYADRLQGEARGILEFRPGITGPATLFFRNEEELLARAADPQKYNDEVIYPIKVKLNLEYARNWSFWRDVGYVLVTVCPPLDRWLRVIPRNISLPEPADNMTWKSE